MSEYPNLTPIHATSTMFISKAGTFSEVLTYDYRDEGLLAKGVETSGKFVRTKLPSLGEKRRVVPSTTYAHFLEDPKNFEREIKIYWGHMQDYMDEEKDIVNGKIVHLKVVDCLIGFRDKHHPYVQWIINFAGDLHPGENTYENYIESEVLEYPIFSTYILESPLKVTRVETTLKYEIILEGHVVKYRGNTGDTLSPYEKLTFFL